MKKKNSTKNGKFCWGILLAQICPAHGARRTAYENVAVGIITIRTNDDQCIFFDLCQKNILRTSKSLKLREEGHKVDKYGK